MKSKISHLLDVGVLYCLFGLIFFLPISNAGISICASLAILLFLVRKVLAPDFKSIGENKIFFLLLFAFFFFMALSLFNSGPLLNKSLKALLVKWGRFPLLIWVIIDTMRDHSRIVKCAWIFVFSSALLTANCLFQKLFGYDLLFHYPLNTGGIITGSFKNQNDLAAYLTGIIPIILCFTLANAYRKSVQASLWGLTVVLLGVLAITLCRGAWIGVVVALISVVLFLWGRHVPKKTFWFLTVTSYFLFIPLITFGLFFFQDRGDSARLMLYQGAWRMITENPFLGKGLGTYMDYCANYIGNIGTYYAHNCFLQIWAESGIFSLLSFLALNAYTLYKTLKITLRNSPGLESRLLIGFSSGLLGFLVHCFFDTQLYSFKLSFLFWTIFGLNLALYSKLKQGQTEF